MTKYVSVTPAPQEFIALHRRALVAIERDSPSFFQRPHMPTFFNAAADESALVVGRVEIYSISILGRIYPALKISAEGLVLVVADRTYFIIDAEAE